MEELQLESVGVRDGETEEVSIPTVREALRVISDEGVGDPPVIVARVEIVGKDVALLPPANPPVKDPREVIVGP